MRAIGIDVHGDFCEVAICEGGCLRSAGRVASRPEELEIFAASLAPDDEVALEATGNALAIARIIEPHVARLVGNRPEQARSGAPGATRTRDTRFRKPTEAVLGDGQPCAIVLHSPRD